MAVSELTKSRGKRSKSTLVASAVVAIMGSAMPFAQAQTILNSSCGLANGSDANSVAIGDGANATGTGAVALGGDCLVPADRTEAAGSKSVAVGYSANVSASAPNAVAIGAYSDAAGINSVAIGSGALAKGARAFAAGGARSSADDAIAIGTGAIASGLQSISIGASIKFQSQATAFGATALGGETTASGTFSSAIGSTSVASGARAFAAGGATSSADKAIAIGTAATASGLQSISIGTDNGVGGTNSGAIGDLTGVSGNASYSYGNNNRISVNNSFAIGNNITINTALNTVKGNVVLGNASADKAFVEVDSATVQGRTATLNADGTVTYTTGPAITYSGFAGTAVGVVSVGKAGAERQIVNVAAGEISATSTDAINGSQLYAVAAAINGSVTNIVNNAQTHFYSVNGTDTDANYANDGATGTNALAAGVGATAAGSSATAVGNGATATGNNSVAVGGATVTAAAASGVAIGNGASTTVSGGVAMGEGSVSSTAAGVAGYVPPSADTTQTAAVVATTSTAGAVAVGSAADGVYRQITGVAAGTENSDAVNVAQLKATVTTAVGSVSMNFAGNSGTNVNVANGGTLAITGEATTAGTYTGANIKTVTDAATGAVNIQMAENPEFTSVTTGNTTINNNGLTINNGPSVTSTGIDANNTVISNVAPGVAGTDAVNVNQLTNVSNQLTNVSNQIGRVEDKLSGGIAASAALAVVTPVEPGTYHLSGGAAYYNGGYGLGLNLLKRSDSGRTTMHAGVAWGSGGGGALVRVGAGFSFGGN